eukprot:scaffold165101_cov13-Cyclotella_meneghiniana.AAC.1
MIQCSNILRKYACPGSLKYSKRSTAGRSKDNNGGSSDVDEAKKSNTILSTKYLPLLPLCLAGSIGILPFLFIMVGIWLCGSLLKTVCSLTEVAIRATATPGAWAFAQQ